MGGEGFFFYFACLSKLLRKRAMRYKKISIKKNLHKLHYLKRSIALLATSVRESGRSEAPFQEGGEKFPWLPLKSTQNCQVLDENGCLLAVNLGWLETMGYVREEVIGRWFGDFLVPRDINIFTKNLLCIGRTGEIIQIVVRMVRKDSSILVVSFKGIISLDDYGIFRQIHCIFEDITHIIRLNAEPENAEERFQVAGLATGLAK